MLIFCYHEDKNYKQVKGTAGERYVQYRTVFSFLLLCYVYRSDIFRVNSDGWYDPLTPPQNKKQQPTHKNTPKAAKMKPLSAKDWLPFGGHKY